MTTKTTNKFSPEVSARAVRLIFDREAEHPYGSRLRPQPGPHLGLMASHGGSRRAGTRWARRASTAVSELSIANTIKAFILIVQTTRSSPAALAKVSGLQRSGVGAFIAQQCSSGLHAVHRQCFEVLEEEWCRLGEPSMAYRQKLSVSEVSISNS